MRDGNGVKVCANWLNFDAIRQTVKNYNQTWGSPDDALDNLTELNMTENCMQCNLKPELPDALNTISEIASLFKSPILTKLESVGMIRKCFKQVEGKE